tara:strand:+ start:415 stop:1131 length:717 start_codon:yes stop_codon:yes gene_type:complete
LENQLEKYQGLTLVTPMTNVPGIATYGIPVQELNRFVGKWGFNGGLERVCVKVSDELHSYLSVTGKNTSIKEWKNIPWSTAGNVVTLFDHHELPASDYWIGHEPLYKPTERDKELRKIWKSRFKNTIETPTDNQGNTLTLNEFVEIAVDLEIPEGHPIYAPEIIMWENIPKSAVKGFVLSPDSFRLQRRKNESVDEYSLNLSPKQSLNILRNRLDRTRSNGANITVSLYDQTGNVLWE